MIIPMSKLLTLGGNKYVFTRATMNAVEKIGNMKDYPEDNKSWKVVPNILKLALDEKIKYDYERDNTRTES